MTRDLSITPLGSCGVVLQRTGNLALADLAADVITRLFREHGLVLWRGFAPTPADFEALAQRFTDTFFLGYGRATFPEHKTITLVNETNLALEPHCDNGIRPEQQRPDITWFYCEAPAESGGETTLFDGVAVWSALSSATRELLLQKRICYLTHFAEPVFTKMGYADPASFERFVKTLGGSVRRINADRSIDVELLSPAMGRTRFSGQHAFVSSLCLAGSRGFESLQVELEGGEPIPAAVLAEIRAALSACGDLIRWQAGDLAMLDNTRYLHGRRGFADTRRRLYLIQTLRANF